MMNAPSLIKPPDAAAGLPLNLKPYAEGEFDRLHAPGTMVASASGVPAIFNKMPQRFGKLAYAMHLTGQKPLPDVDDLALIKIGNLLEPLAAELLAEKTGGKVVRYQAYSNHPWLPLFATPDAIAWIDDILHIVEIKTVNPRQWREHWSEGPPIHVELQHQAQFACTGANAGIIVALSPAYGTIDHWIREPNQPAIDKIELGIDCFMAKLGRDELPAPDDTEADFEAFKTLMSLGREKETISLESQEAAKRAAQWFQAKKDEKAATATLEAHRRWFTRRMGRAEIAKISPEFEAHWSTVGRAKGADKAHRNFAIKEPKQPKEQAHG